MGGVIGKLGEYAEELKSRAPHAVCGHATVNPGVIRGGSISSSVPDYCELELDRRTLPGETLETVTHEYRQLLAPLADDFPAFDFEIGGRILDNSPLDTPVDSRIVSCIADAFREVTGNAATVGAFTAATDAPNFHCPAVICGPGSIMQAHTLDEYVAIDELVASARIYLRSILNLLS
jgi:acetylornithine deacetylase